MHCYLKDIYSFYHEETSEACEALQILIRPEQDGLDSGVQFFARDVENVEGWQLLGAPKEIDAPLVSEIQVDDTFLSKGDAIAGNELYEHSLKTIKKSTLVLFLVNEQA